MIDFHTHILPNVDDGSTSVDETFMMLKEANFVGFDRVISTSHYMEGYYEIENKERKMLIDAINKKAQEQKIKTQMYLGSEIYLSDNIINLLQEFKAATINNTSYVLFETALNVKPLNLDNMIFEMIHNGIVPILAHPERYSFIQKDPNLIGELIERGVLMQCNYGSFLGRYGTKAEIVAKEMLLKDMVHLLGTDAHRQGSIYLKVPEIIKLMIRMVGEEKVKELTETNPELVLNNKRIYISEPSEIKITFKDIIKMNLRK